MGESSTPTLEEIEAWELEEKQETLQGHSDFFHAKLKEDRTEGVTETLHLNNAGEISANGPDGKSLVSLFVTMAETTEGKRNAEAIYQAAAELQDFDPTILFTFNHDFVNNTLSYTVTSPSTVAQ